MNIGRVQFAEFILHRKQRPTCLTYVVNTLAADDLATQGTRISAAMVVTWLAWNILCTLMKRFLKNPGTGVIPYRWSITLISLAHVAYTVSSILCTTKKRTEGMSSYVHESHQSAQNTVSHCLRLYKMYMCFLRCLDIIILSYMLGEWTCLSGLLCQVTTEQCLVLGPVGQAQLGPLLLTWFKLN